LVEREAPELPAEGWAHVRPVLSGICGSDLTTLDGRSSRYFEDIVSFPFVPGHEVVGTLGETEASWGEIVGAEGTALASGSRVVVQPVLGCAARGIEPMCPACRSGHVGNCGYLAFGHIRPGLQTGFCADTGGGWSSSGLVAHRSQLFGVPVGLSDADAVMIEPLSCAVHAVLAAPIADGDIVAVVGAGTLGLLVTAALGHLASTGRCASPSVLLIGAKYAHQQRFAREFGGTEALAPEQLPRAVRRHARSLSYGGRSGMTATLSGGADVVFDCVGSPESIAQSLGMVRPRGTVSLVGMPGKVTIDLAPLWHREVRLAGAYAYGTENVAEADTGGGTTPTFDIAFEVAAAMGVGRLVSASYPLTRFEEAVAHAGNAGRRGAVKIAFDLRDKGQGRGQDQEHEQRGRGRPR
jgi:threonine dehydrogenase-like Zn-dependent dehydrogenase